MQTQLPKPRDAVDSTANSNSDLRLDRHAAARPFRKRVGADEVSGRIQVGDNPSPMILALSPCRSGSTALLRGFAHAGLDAYYQPIKNILRWRLVGGEQTWSVPQGGEQPIYVKETLGPYTPQESTLDPVATLLRAGYPSERLKVLITMRDPYETWASWRKTWGARTALDLFVAAYRQPRSIRERAAAAEIPVVHMAYEQYRTNGAESVLEAVKRGLGVAYAGAVADWSDDPGFAAEGSRLIQRIDPPEFHTEGTLDRAKATSAIGYVSRGDRVQALPDAERNAIVEAGIENDYAHWLQLAEADYARWC